MNRTYSLKHKANEGKQEQVRATIAAYRITAETLAKIQWRCFFEAGNGFNKNLNIKAVPSPLSERYKQTCQYQVIGTLESFISNRKNDFVRIIMKSSLDETRRHKMLFINKCGFWYISAPFSMLKAKMEITAEDLKLARKVFNHILSLHRRPSFHHANMALDSKVALITEKTPGKAKAFDYWVRLSTLAKGKPIMLPLKSNEYFEGIPGSRKNFYQINLKEDGSLAVAFIKDVPREIYTPETPKIALDLGLVNLFTTDRGDMMGRRFYEILQKYDALISRLAANRQRQGLKTRSPKYDNLVNNLREFTKNESNRVINRLIEQYKPAEIAVERLNFQNSSLSKRMNRLLSRFGKAFVTLKLKTVEEAFGIKVTYKNPAYSSQECSACAYVDKNNRLSQAVFACKCCGSSMHADVNAARNLLGRSSAGEYHIHKSRNAVLQEQGEAEAPPVRRLPLKNLVTLSQQLSICIVVFPGAFALPLTRGRIAVQSGISYYYDSKKLGKKLRIHPTTKVSWLSPHDIRNIFNGTCGLNFFQLLICAGQDKSGFNPESINQVKRHLT